MPMSVSQQNDKDAVLREFYREIKTLQAKFPAKHPVQFIHTSMATILAKSRTYGRGQGIGLLYGVWQIFVPSHRLYIQLLPVHSIENQSPTRKAYQQALLPYGYSFYETRNWASAVLLVMEWLNIEDEMMKRTLRVTEAQIDGSLILLRRERMRLRRQAKKIKDERRELRAEKERLVG